MKVQHSRPAFSCWHFSLLCAMDIFLSVYSLMPIHYLDSTKNLSVYPFLLQNPPKWWLFCAGFWTFITFFTNSVDDKTWQLLLCLQVQYTSLRVCHYSTLKRWTSSLASTISHRNVRLTHWLCFQPIWALSPNTPRLVSHLRISHCHLEI